MLKYKVGNEFFLDGGQSVCDEKIEIYKVLKANNKINIDCYLCICSRDSNCDNTFDNIFYEIMDDNLLDDECYRQIK